MSLEEAHYAEGYRDGLKACRAALLALDWLKRNRSALMSFDVELDGALQELDAIITPPPGLARGT